MWLVFNPNGNTPKFVHHDEDSARKECERLARNHRGEEFYVLKAIASVRINEFTWTDLTKDKTQMEIPF